MKSIIQISYDPPVQADAEGIQRLTGESQQEPQRTGGGIE